MSQLTVTNKDRANELINLAAMPGDLIKKEMDANYLALLVSEHPNLDQKYFVDFISKAMLTGADPRMNEIYLVVHDTWSKEKGRTEPKGTPIFDYKFLMKKAASTGELDSHEVEVFEESYLDIVTGRKRPSYTAVATVWRKGKKITFKARFWEFAKTNKEGVPSGNWKAMPMFMLEKTAMANALRWAFPDQLGSIYIAEEMEKVTQSVTPNPVPAIAPAIPPAPAQPAQIETQQPTESAKDPELEKLRDEMIAVIVHAVPELFTKIGIDKGTMLAKIMAENDIAKMHDKYNWLGTQLDKLKETTDNGPKEDVIG